MHSLLTKKKHRFGYRARRRQKVVLKGLEASLEEGHLVGLVEPNGAGKSTLLRTVSGLQPPLAGSEIGRAHV